MEHDDEERWNIGNLAFYEVKSLVQFLKGAGAQLESLATQFDFGPLAKIAGSINRTTGQLLKGLALIEECCEFDYSARIRKDVARERFPDQPEMLQQLSQLAQVMTTGPGVFKVTVRDTDEKLADLEALAQINKIKAGKTWGLHAKRGWLVDRIVGFTGDPPECVCNLGRKLEDEELVVLNKHLVKGVYFEETPPAVWCQPGRLLLPQMAGMEKPLMIQVDVVFVHGPDASYYLPRGKRLPRKGKGRLRALPGGNG